MRIPRSALAVFIALALTAGVPGIDCYQAMALDIVEAPVVPVDAGIRVAPISPSYQNDMGGFGSEGAVDIYDALNTPGRLDTSGPISVDVNQIAATGLVPVERTALDASPSALQLPNVAVINGEPGTLSETILETTAMKDGVASGLESHNPLRGFETLRPAGSAVQMEESKFPKYMNTAAHLSQWKTEMAEAAVRNPIAQYVGSRDYFDRQTARVEAGLRLSDDRSGAVPSGMMPEEILRSLGRTAGSGENRASMAASKLAPSRELLFYRVASIPEENGLLHGPIGREINEKNRTDINTVTNQITTGISNARSDLETYKYTQERIAGLKAAFTGDAVMSEFLGDLRVSLGTLYRHEQQHKSGNFREGLKYFLSDIKGETARKVYPDQALMRYPGSPFEPIRVDQNKLKPTQTSNFHIFHDVPAVSTLFAPLINQRGHVLGLGGVGALAAIAVGLVAMPSILIDFGVVAFGIAAAVITYLCIYLGDRVMLHSARHGIQDLSGRSRRPKQSTRLDRTPQ